MEYSSTDIAPAMDKPKAQELIAQLQKHQQDQIQCLQALFGLASEGKNEEKGPGNMEEVEGRHACVGSPSEKRFASPFSLG